jgi:hypothetical protein
MSQRAWIGIAVLASAGLILGVMQTPIVAGQAAKPAAPPPRAEKAWTPASKTPDGQPDLQGTWTNFDSTPMEVEAGRPTGASYAGDFDQVDSPISPTRPSMVVEPKDGRVRIKALAEEKRDYDRARITDHWLHQSPWERCITRGVPGIMLPSNYNNGYEIRQIPGYVVIHHEMIHETRLIPLDGRPHLSPKVRLWMGDSRGHWEGNTLVVETTNFNDKGWITNNGASGRLRGVPVSEELKVTERFTRVSQEKINYEFTVEDPKNYDSPWKVAMPLNRDPKYKILEYACHEGNNAMVGTLSLGRQREQKAAAAGAVQK